MFGHQGFPDASSAPWAVVTLFEASGATIATNTAGLATVNACAGYQNHVVFTDQCLFTSRHSGEFQYQYGRNVTG
jgi:hypothetical protein